MTQSAPTITTSTTGAQQSGDFQLPVFLRLDGMAALAASIALYANSGASWWMFFLLLLAPDVSMIGYLAGNRVGAIGYNLAHSYIMPITLGLAGLVFGFSVAPPLAAIWTAHIGLDRVLGYGLKKTSGFKDTHIGNL